MLRQIWWKVFPPIEVKWTRESIRTACRATYTTQELLGPCLEQTRDVERVLYSIRIDRHTPETLAALLIGNMASRLLVTGRFHIYRGVLSHAGLALSVAWTESNLFLVKSDRLTMAEHKKEWDELSHAIREVG